MRMPAEVRFLRGRGIDGYRNSGRKAVSPKLVWTTYHLTVHCIFRVDQHDKALVGMSGEQVGKHSDSHMCRMFVECLIGEGDQVRSRESYTVRGQVPAASKGSFYRDRDARWHAFNSFRPGRSIPRLRRSSAPAYTTFFIAQRSERPGVLCPNTWVAFLPSLELMILITSLARNATFMWSYSLTFVSARQYQKYLNLTSLYGPTLICITVLP